MRMRAISTVPKDGTRVLVYFRQHGWLVVAWTSSKSLSIPIWCVDDFKFGPYPLRGYCNEGVLGWMPLPPEPKGAA